MPVTPACPARRAKTKSQVSRTKQPGKGKTGKSASEQSAFQRSGLSCLLCPLSFPLSTSALAVLFRFPGVSRAVGATRSGRPWLEDLSVSFSAT